MIGVPSSSPWFQGLCPVISVSPLLYGSGPLTRISVGATCGLDLEDLHVSPPGITVRNMVLYGADKAVIVYIVHSELYRIVILPNNTIIIPSISLLPHLLF
jgi:hypothetical protein